MTAPGAVGGGGRPGGQRGDCRRALRLACRHRAGWCRVEQLGVGRGSFLERLMMVEPLPGGLQHAAGVSMDGGRVLRPCWRERMEYTRATQIAANVGQGMAFLFGFAGLFGNPMLLFIALFVWIGAAQESTAVQIKSALGGHPGGARHADRLPHASAGDSLRARRN